MEDALFVHVFHALTDLTHEMDAFSFRQFVVVVDYAFQELSASDSGEKRKAGFSHDPLIYRFVRIGAHTPNNCNPPPPPPPFFAEKRQDWVMIP